MRADLDTTYMRLALHQAKKGIGRTSPNPCVGAIIVKDDTVIASGYHKKAGTPHAEIHALQKAGAAARGSTMYVTLEPCNHTGKTPPCSHAVAAAGISRVVVGMVDPNPLVSGSGITYLRERNIEVVSGILSEKCEEINRPFIKFITTGQPWTVMKAGISLDGKLNYRKGQGGRITGERSSEKVHRLRNIFDAILVGAATARIDNPSLTTRLTRGKGRDPIRVILDTNLSVPADAAVYSVESEAPAWVFCDEKADMHKAELLSSQGVRVFPLPCNDSQLDLKRVVHNLGQEGITSLLVEGGATIHGAMLGEALFDYAYLFIAPIFAGEKGISLISGLGAANRDDAISLSDISYTRMGEDVMVAGSIVYP